MLTIPDQRVLSSVRGAKVAALPVRTGEPFGGDASGGLLGDFSLQTTGVQALALALHPTRPGRRDDRRGSYLGCVASGDGGAYGTSWQLLLAGQNQDGANKETTARAGRA